MDFRCARTLPSRPPRGGSATVLLTFSQENAWLLKTCVLVLALFLALGVGIGSAAFGHIFFGESASASGRHITLGELEGVLAGKGTGNQARAGIPGHPDRR